MFYNSFGQNQGVDDSANIKSKASSFLPITFSGRKSMIPVYKTSSIRNKEKILKPIFAQDSVKMPETASYRDDVLIKRREAGLSCLPKPIKYSCNICNDKFRIKTLLDAHQCSIKNANNEDKLCDIALDVLQQSSTFDICREIVLDSKDTLSDLNIELPVLETAISSNESVENKRPSQDSFEHQVNLQNFGFSCWNHS